MRDMRDIVEVAEVSSLDKANELLQSDDWFLLDTASGQDAERARFSCIVLAESTENRNRR